MKYLDVHVRLPNRMLHPMQEFIRNEETAHYEELVSWRVRPETGLEYELFYVEADLEEYQAALDDVDSVLDYQLTPIDDSSGHLLVCQETRPEDRAWRGPFSDRNLILVPPVRFDDTAAMGMTFVGAGEDMNRLVDELPPEIDLTVNEIGTYNRRGGTLAGALTNRQLEAVAAALRLGYYEVPRRASLAAVAESLECAESTASVLLRRAEQAVFSRLLDRYGGNASHCT